MAKNHNSNKKVDKGIAKFLGEVVEVLTGSEYRVKITLGDVTKIVTSYAAGKLSNNRIRILEGDMVDVELDKKSLADGKGRIVYRHTTTNKN